MFTGLIEGIEKVVKSQVSGGYFVASIEPSFDVSNLTLGESIAINGCCLTVSKIFGKAFEVQLSQESLDKTTLGKLKVNDLINLERSIKVGSLVGGHFVTGHIDGVATIKAIEGKPGLTKLELVCDKRFSSFLVDKGSVAIDGVSLTVVDPYEVGQNVGFFVALIPHTLDNTTLKYRKVGDKVNLETDIIGKYVAKQLGKKTEGITEGFLREHGF